MTLSFLDDWLDNRADAPFNLGESGVSNCRLSDVIPQDKLRHELAEVDFDHNNTRGSQTLREEIAKLYDGAAVANVLVTAGVSEAILLYFMSRRSPGANVVVVTPAFHSLYDVPAALGFEVNRVGTAFENGFQLPLEEIAANADDNTCAVVLTTPGNPAGTVFTTAEAMPVMVETRCEARVR